MEQRDGSQRACLERMSQEFLFTTAAAASDHTAWRKWSCGRCAYADWIWDVTLSEVCHKRHIHAETIRELETLISDCSRSKISDTIYVRKAMANKKLRQIYGAPDRIRSCPDRYSYCSRRVVSKIESQRWVALFKFVPWKSSQLMSCCCFWQGAMQEERHARLDKSETNLWESRKELMAERSARRRATLHWCNINRVVNLSPPFPNT